MVDNPVSLRKQAHSIAASARRPDEAWSELRIWASGKGPLALKSAMIEFISVHGTSPEAALLMPQLLRDRSLSSLERKEMLSMQSELEPKADLIRPRLEAPKAAFLSAVSHPHANHNDVRDMHLVLRERALPTLGMPKASRFDASKSPDSHTFSIGMHRGERLVRNLVEKMKGHAAEHPVQGISGTVNKAPRRSKAKARKPKRALKKKARPRKAPKKTRRRK